MRLIDADATIYALNVANRGDSKDVIRNLVICFLLASPTVDAVPVIRCRDCKHCRRELAQGKWEGSCRYWNTHSVMLNDFCSYGERKDNEIN